MAHLQYNLLFRRFVGRGIDDPVWDHATDSKTRDRLPDGDIARKFLKGIVAHDQVKSIIRSC